MRPLTWKQCRLMALLSSLIEFIVVMLMVGMDPKYESAAIKFFIVCLVLPAGIAIIAFSMMAYSRWKEEESGSAETVPAYITVDDSGEFTVKSARELIGQRVEMNITTVKEAREMLDRIEDIYGRQGVISREDYDRVRGQLLDFIEEASEP